MPPAACSAYCVHPCVYVFVYASMCACTYVFVGYVCVFVYVASACVCVDACMHPCLSYVCVDACMHPCLSINMCVRICAYTRACVYMSAPGRQACDARAQTRTAFRQGHPVWHTQVTRMIRTGNLTRQDTTAEHDTWDGSAFMAMAGRFFEVAGVTCGGMPARQAALPRASLAAVSSCALLLSRLLLLLPLLALLLAPATVSVDASRADL